MIWSSYTLRLTLPVLTLFTSIFCSSASALPLLDLSASTISLGVDASAPLKWSNISPSSSNFQINAHFGVFAWYEIEIFLESSFETELIIERDHKSSRLGALAGIKYVSDTWGVIYPYIGLQAGFTWPLNGDSNVLIPLQLPLGIMIAFNKNFAIDLGLPIGIAFSFQRGFESFDFMVGHLGGNLFF